jgi:pumilio RNA-binding family
VVLIWPIDILENGRLEERSAIIRTLTGKILEMSKHKYTSNIIEKGLHIGGPQEQHLMVDEILTLAIVHDALQVYNLYI